MQIQLVRHATLLVTYGGRRFLVDPMLSPAGALAPVANAANDRRFPLVELPFPPADVVAGADTLLLTHLHRDHWDDVAQAAAPRDMPVFCQPEDESRLAAQGFARITPVPEAVDAGGVEIIRTGGRHGTGLHGMAMGKVSGFVLRAPGEPVLCIAGDTVWCGEVRDALETYRPDVVVVNAGAAQFRTGSPITMDDRDVEMVCRTAPEARVVAVHMDTVNHCLLTRDLLRDALERRGLTGRVAIPADGERLEFPG